ncbi:hypothetical protein XM47_18005 [Catenovulum maritimum]|uniref:SGNH hydrolase-type esterase domain-containing protein n=1 Tax=Catenovulum maritimum TaxID=1513271 RepID=A0A0J8GST8_9ALTE|nr:hypothetical protein XM47_18005 [Catenovulum maritimum]
MQTQAKPDSATVPSVFIIGDSTASFYKADKYPRMGWGMALDKHLKPEIQVYNKAVSGRSSRSFMGEGWFDKFKNDIQLGDYLLIQFGHNDQKKTNQRYTQPYTSYQAYLTQYIEFARSRGATPVLLTSINRFKFDKTKTSLILTHGEYPNAMRALAKKLKVSLIDLTQLTESKFNLLGYDKTKKLFLYYPAGLYDAYPDGVADGTHLSELGADFITQLIRTELVKIAPHLIKE